MRRSRKRLVWFLALLMVANLLSPIATESYAKKKTIKVKKITLNHSSYKLQKGKTLKLKVSFKPKKTTQKKIVWSSSKKSVAKVSGKGVVKALKVGKATISAKVKGTKKKAVCKIQVINKKRSNSDLTPLPTDRQEDSSSQQTKEVEVNSISISPGTASIYVGGTQQMTVNFSPSNVKDKNVEWSSSDKEIATVSSTGLVETKKVGTVTITAKTSRGGKTAQATIKVLPIDVTGIKIVSDKTEIKIGETVQLKAEIEPLNATNKKVKWTSSDDDIASVDDNGLVTAKAVGQATITVTSEDNKSKQDFVVIIVPEVAVTDVVVNPLECSLKPDEKVELTATVYPENATNKKVTWSSSDKNIAVVSQSGVVTAVREGKAEITATTEDGNKQAVCKVTVEFPVTGITLSKTEETMPAGKSFSLSATVEPENATNKNVVWSSSDEAVATVDENGLVTTVKDGVADIKVSSENGKFSAICRLKVETLPTKVVLPEEKAIEVDEECTLAATVYPENAANKNVTWETSDEQVVTVDATGKIKGIKKGTAVITVKTVEGNQSAKCNVTVGTIKTVSSFEELQSVLADAKIYDKITVSTQESGTVEIGAGDYSETILIVDAPNATVINQAKLKRIEIQNISSDTWIEKATGNTIDVVAENSHVQVAEGATSKIEIYGKAENVRIENNGTITSLMLNAVANVSITGDNRNIIPVEAKVADAVIDTEVPIKLDASEKIKLIIEPGAESQTTVNVAKTSAIPSIEGVGVIQITNEETNEITDVVAENTGKITDETGSELKGTISGVVKNSEEQLLSGAAVYAIPYTQAVDQSDIDAAIKAAEDQQTCYATSTNADGVYSLDVPYGNYALVIKSDGYNNYFQVIIVNQETISNQTVTMTPVTEEKGNVEGTLYDAEDASTVPEGIKLLLREGADNVSGDVVAETVTGDKGNYKFENLNTGYYTIQVTDERDVSQVYVRMSFNIVILPGVTVKENMTITKIVKDAQVRFVLTWGAKAKEVPSDLDSHLTGPTTIEGVKFHTYYSDRYYKEGSTQYVDLDVDDTDYEGPETTTIYKAVDGLYHFYIHDYTDKEKSDNTRLSTSQAVVKVFKGDQNIETYYVPNGIGTLWDVCTYDPATNKLEPINKIYYHPGDTSEVGLDPIDIAKSRLLNAINQYEECDFGEALADEQSQKIQNARELLQENEDFQMLLKSADSLNNYFTNLLNSTAISNIVDDDVEEYEIYRQGEFFDDNRLQGYSVIRIYGYQSSCIEDLKVTCMSSDATYTITDSDKDTFQKLLTVTSSETKAVEKYYLSYKEYVPSFVPYDVTDGDNYILNCGLDYEDESSEEVPYIYVEGENETLVDPEFVFSNVRVSGTYEAIDGDDTYVGKLSVTYKDTTKVYPVKYIRRFRKLSLEKISEKENPLSEISSEYDYDEDDNEYKVYKVSGLKDKLGDIQCEFSLQADRYSLLEEDGAFWNYRIDVVYKGETQKIYLRYSQCSVESMLPTEGRDDDSDLRKIELLKDDDTETVRLLGWKTEIENWDALRFSGQYEGVSYQVTTDGDDHYLSILQGETELAKYPVFYEKDIELCLCGVKDGDNYITDWDTDYDWDQDDQRYDIIAISGENMSLDEPEFSVDEGAMASYEEVSDSSKGIGKLTITYKTQIKEYWVQYKQRIRNIFISKVSAEGSSFSDPNYDWQYDEDDNKYKVWTISGTKESLDDTVRMTFNIEPEKYQIEADEESSLWNYVITLDYKGTVQKVYVKYNQKEVTQDMQSTITTDKGVLTIDENQSYNIPLTALNETTATSVDKRSSDSDPVTESTVFNRDGSVTFTSSKDYESGVSFYINPCTSEDQLEANEDNEEIKTFANGMKDVSEYDYIRVKLTSEGEMNMRTYGDISQFVSSAFPGSSSSETYEAGWILPTAGTEDTIFTDQTELSAGKGVKEEYKTRTIFIPMALLTSKGMDPEKLEAIAFSPQSTGVEVTIHRVDFVKVKYEKLVTGLEVSAAKTEIAPGKTTTVSAKVTPADATRETVKWTSSDETIATVNFQGTVIANHKTGEVTITATSTDGSNVSGSVKIKVAEPTEEPVEVTTHKVDLTKVVAKANTGSGTVDATKKADAIEFEAGASMTYVDMAEYLANNDLELSNYTSLDVTWEVRDADGNKVTDYAGDANAPTYGHISYNPTSKLNGYDGGIDTNYTGEDDAEKNTSWLATPYTGQTCSLVIAKTNPAELATVTGFNLQLEKLPENMKIVITDITLVKD